MQPPSFPNRGERDIENDRTSSERCVGWVRREPISVRRELAFRERRTRTCSREILAKGGGGMEDSEAPEGRISWQEGGGARGAREAWNGLLVIPGNEMLRRSQIGFFSLC